MTTLEARGATATHQVRVEDSPRRVRVFFNNVAIADSRRVKLLFETNHLPVYYFPLADLRQDLLVPTDHGSHCPYKGDARYWSIRVGDRVAENAVWNYPTPLPSCPEIGDLAAFYWDRVDAWYEEDEEVFVHPRDPYHRVDVLESSRHVQVLIDGVTVADTHRPRLLFETGLPTRYYLHPLDVRLDLLRPSQTHTRCPYKGVASYWSAQVGDAVLEDVVWSYQAPIPESAKIAGLLSFFNEKVDLIVDGERQERPRTRWS
jgi:uncharacterized protein (DUF427 family)